MNPLMITRLPELKFLSGWQDSVLSVAMNNYDFYVWQQKEDLPCFEDLTEDDGMDDLLYDVHSDTLFGELYQDHRFEDEDEYENFMYYCSDWDWLCREEIATILNYYRVAYHHDIYLNFPLVGVW